MRRGSSLLSRWSFPVLPQTSDDRPQCLENPRPAGAESTLTENARSPFHAEPRHMLVIERMTRAQLYFRLDLGIPTLQRCYVDSS